MRLPLIFELNHTKCGITRHLPHDWHTLSAFKELHQGRGWRRWSRRNTSASHRRNGQTPVLLFPRNHMCIFQMHTSGGFIQVNRTRSARHSLCGNMWELNQPNGFALKRYSGSVSDLIYTSRGFIRTSIFRKRRLSQSWTSGGDVDFFSARATWSWGHSERQATRVKICREQKGKQKGNRMGKWRKCSEENAWEVRLRMRKRQVATFRLQI